MVVLEEYEHAQEARRQDLCRADRLRHVGRRLSHHRAGSGWRRRLPQHAGGAASAPALRAGDLDYINAHGTSTPLGDEIELGAVQRLVGNAASQISMSSTKSCIGHLLGAAGAVEAIFSMLAIRDKVAPPTINLDHPSVETPIDLVPQQAARARYRRGPVQFLRLRRHQCVFGVPTSCGLAGATAISFTLQHYFVLPSVTSGHDFGRGGKRILQRRIESRDDWALGRE